MNAVAHPRLTAVGLGCLGLAWVAFPALGLVGMPPFTLHMSQHMLVVLMVFAVVQVCSILFRYQKRISRRKVRFSLKTCFK